MNSHPVSFSLPRPDHFERVHVAVRLLLLMALAVVGMPQGGWFLLLMLLLPAFAAVQAANKGGARYLKEDGPFVVTVMHWLLGAYAYLALLTDRLPDKDFRNHVGFSVEVQGSATPSSALWRLVMSLPALLMLALLGIVSSVVWVVSMVLVAFTGNYPAALFDFQCGVLRYLARILAYHASLVELYPTMAVLAASDGPRDMGHPNAA